MLRIKTQLALYVLCLWIVMLVYSKFVLANTMILILFLGYFNYYNNEGKFAFTFNKEPFKNIFDFKKNLPFAVITLFFFVYVFSFWQNQGDLSYYLERLRIKLPFLALPIAFLGIPKFSKRQFYSLLIFLLFFVILNSIGVLTNYWLNYEEVQQLMHAGKSMPTPCDHIRFSILVAFAILAGLYLYIKDANCWSIPKIVFLIASFVLFIFIHILSVRTGILCLYFALAVCATSYALSTKRYIILLCTVVVLASLPFAAYYTVPSFKQKMDYMTWDHQQFAAGKGGVYSNSGRITSMQVGWDQFVENPIFGIGVGNLERETKKIYANKYPSYSKALVPHSQFIFTLAATGIFGFIFFMIAFLVPFFFNGAYKDLFFLGFYAIFTVAFLIEHSIENAVGIGTFLLFLLVMLRRRNI